MKAGDQANCLVKAVWGFWHALALPLFISLALLLSHLWFLHDPSLPITSTLTVVLWSDFLSAERKEGISLPNHLCSDVNCCSRDEGLYILWLCHLVSRSHAVSETPPTYQLEALLNAFCVRPKESLKNIRDLKKLKKTSRLERELLLCYSGATAVVFLKLLDESPKSSVHNVTSSF